MHPTSARHHLTHVYACEPALGVDEQEREGLKGKFGRRKWMSRENEKQSEKTKERK